MTIEEIFFWLSMLIMFGFALYLLYETIVTPTIAQIICPNCYTLNPCVEDYCYECGSEIQDY